MSKYGSFVLQSGIVNGKEIKENLLFKQASLYQELNLLLDIMSLRLDEIGGFKGWLSEEDQKQLQTCPNPILLLVYTLDETRIRQSLVTSQMYDFGFKLFAISGFRENLLMHPGAVENSLKMYKSYTFCGPQVIPSPLVLTIPGFEPVEIRL